MDHSEEHEHLERTRTEEINFGTEEEPKILTLGKDITPQERTSLIKLITEYLDVFAFSYEDMPGLPTSLVEHRIDLKPDAKPVRQKPRRYHPDVALKVKEEISKLLKAKFIRTVVYPDWVANIVPVKKKDGQGTRLH